MPRVLLTGFCAVPGPRRAGVQLRHVVRSLTPLHSVDLLVVREADQAYVERQGSVRILRVPTNDPDPRSQIQAFQRALKRQLDGADYDVIHCRDSWSGIPVLELRERLGYAVVYDLSRSPLGETTFDGELDAQYGRDEEACLLAADMVLAPTPAAVKSLQGRGKPDRVMLSPCGVDVDRFDWDDPPRSGPPRILYVGSIDAGRGVRVLVRAMAAIVREVDARLVLAGSMAPRFEQPLRDGIRELGLTDKIEILAPIEHDQVPMLLATATVCVVPGAADLSPNPTVVYPTKLLEYMACRRAIVAPKRETVTAILDHGRDALLFEPGDPLDLARKVLRLLGEPLLRDKLAAHAYDRVRRELTASSARRALRKAYEVLGERFADHFEIEQAVDESPKVELLSDDDFEATVFSESPETPHVDTSISGLSLVDEQEDAASSPEAAIAPPPPPQALTSERDETVERAPVKPNPREVAETGPWLAATPPPPPRTTTGEEWVVTSMVKAGRSIAREPKEADSGEISGETHGDDGTPIEGVVAAAPALPTVEEGTFVAGEIDVPTPPPERREPVEFSAVGVMLGQQPEAPDPDTGSRTPPRS